MQQYKIFVPNTAHAFEALKKAQGKLLLSGVVITPIDYHAYANKPSIQLRDAKGRWTKYVYKIPT